MNTSNDAVIVRRAPAGGCLPLVCDSPHSGTHYPADFRSALPLDLLRQAEDTYVDTLWSAAPEIGATLVAARFPRSYIDPNRALEDLDPDLLDGPWPTPLQPGEKSRLGYGLVWRKLDPTHMIYDRRLSVAEVQQRIARCWQPYRDQLQQEIDSAIAAFGGVWHLHLHSMPNNAYARLGLDPNRPLADFVLGDRDGTTCEPGFVDVVERCLRGFGYIARAGSETSYFTLAVLRHFERQGVAMVNSSAAVDTVADKLHTLQILSAHGLPTPKTILGKFPVDVDLIERQLGFPVVVKTLTGTRGNGVLLCRNRDQFADLAMLLDGTQHEANFIFQEYVATSHGRDVRVLVVGGRPVAAMERRATNGSFKSNVSLGAEAVPFELKPDMARLAVDAADALNLDVAGVDILFDRDGYRICEANSSPGFQGLERATGVDVPQLVFESMFARRHRMGPRLHRAVDSVKRLYAGVGGCESLPYMFRKAGRAPSLRYPP